MKRISIRQPIIDAIDETDASLGRFQNQMLKWAKYLEKEIGSKYGYKIVSKKFNVTGCTITLPDNCYRVLMVLPGDYEDECNARYQDVNWPQIRSDTTHEDDYFSWLWIPLEVRYLEEYLWEEVLDELHFVYSYTGNDLTVIYQTIETDENGFWIINESHSDAITKFIKFKFAGKFNWKLFKSDKMLRGGHLNYYSQLEREYNIAVRHARAEDGQVTPFQREQF